MAINPIPPFFLSLKYWRTECGTLWIIYLVFKNRLFPVKPTCNVRTTFSKSDKFTVVSKHFFTIGEPLISNPVSWWYFLSEWSWGWWTFLRFYLRTGELFLPKAKWLRCIINWTANLRSWLTCKKRSTVYCYDFTVHNQFHVIEECYKQFEW